jgi:hypothetical protein
VTLQEQRERQSVSAWNLNLEHIPASRRSLDNLPFKAFHTLQGVKLQPSQPGMVLLDMSHLPFGYGAGCFQMRRTSPFDFTP